MALACGPKALLKDGATKLAHDFRESVKEFAAGGEYPDDTFWVGKNLFRGLENANDLAFGPRSAFTDRFEQPRAVLNSLLRGKSGTDDDSLSCEAGAQRHSIFDAPDHKIVLRYPPGEATRAAAM